MENNNEKKLYTLLVYSENIAGVASMIALLNLNIISASAPWMSSLSVMHLGNLLISVSRPTHKKLFLAKICSTSSFLFIMD